MSGNVKRDAITKKSRARRYAMQSMYQYLLTQIDNSDAESNAEEAAQTLIDEWLQRDDLSEFDVDFYKALFTNALSFQGNLDLQIASYASRSLKQLGVVEHAILLIGAVELQREPTPAKVVINEAIILAKQFAGEDSHKFINGILDKIHKQQ